MKKIFSLLTFTTLLTACCNSTPPESDAARVRKSCQQIAKVELLMNRIALTEISLNNLGKGENQPTEQQKNDHNKVVAEADKALKALNEHQTQLYEWISPRVDNYMNTYVTCLEFEGIRNP